MADYWIKWYHEIIDDPKMATLPDRLWRRFSELCLLAGRLDKDKGGMLPNTQQLAWALRMPTDELQHDIQQLISCGLVEAIPNGWLVVNFKKRQEAVTGAERVKQHRKREQQEQYYNDGNELVTNSYIESEDRLTESEDRTETEAESGAPTFDGILQVLKKETGVPPSGEAGIKAINQMIANGCTLADVKAGCRWLIDEQRQTIRYYSSVVGPANTAKLKRTQKSTGTNGHKPRTISETHTDIEGNKIIIYSDGSEETVPCKK